MFAIMIGNKEMIESIKVMPKVSKIINEELVLKAERALNKLGKDGVVVMRLKAIIASSKHGIKKVAEVL